MPKSAMYPEVSIAPIAMMRFVEVVQMIAEHPSRVNYQHMAYLLHKLPQWIIDNHTFLQVLYVNEPLTEKVVRQARELMVGTKEV